MRILLLAGCLLLVACSPEGGPSGAELEEARKTVDSMLQDSQLRTIPEDKPVPEPPPPPTPAVAQEKADKNKTSSPFYKIAVCADWNYANSSDDLPCCDSLLSHFKAYYDTYLAEGKYEEAAGLLRDPYIIACKKYVKYATVLEKIEAGE